MTSALLLRDLVRCFRPTSILDIGANPVAGAAPYQEMLEYGLCMVTGFAPHQPALAALESRKGPLEKYRSEVVADGREHRLKITQAVGMNSLLTPDQNRLRLFNGFSEWGTVVEEHDVDTHRLDDLDIDDFDLLKVDARGSELMIFQNGRSRLGDAVAVHSTMSLVPLYHGQPTFGEVDSELRSQGFMPHSIPDVKRWALAPTVFDDDIDTPGNQVLEAEVVYVRDLAHPERMTSDQLSHLAMIAFHIYGSVDLTVRCIVELQQRGKVADDAVEQLMTLFD